MTAAIHSLNYFASAAWAMGEYAVPAAATTFTAIKEGAQTCSRALKPWQPLIATAKICGKLGYRAYRHQTINKQIKEDLRMIPILQAIAKDPKSPQARKDKALARLDMRKKRLAECQRQLDIGKLTLGHIPSLFFSNPDRNQWQDAHNLVNRIVGLNHTVNPVRQTNLVETSLCAAAGVVSMVGTAASIFSSCGLVSPSSPAVSSIIHVASAIGVFEVGWMAYKNYPSIRDHIYNLPTTVCNLRDNLYKFIGRAQPAQ